VLNLYEGGSAAKTPPPIGSMTKDKDTLHWLLAGQTSYPEFARKFMGFTLLASLYLGSVILIVAAGMLTARLISALFHAVPGGVASSLSDAAYLLNAF